MSTPWCVKRYAKDNTNRIERWHRKKNELMDGQPSGLIGIPTHNLGRYREFEAALLGAFVPSGTTVSWGQGINTARNMNEFVRKLLKSDAQWLWIMGDDHSFPPDILIRLLGRNKRIVAPLCLRRTYPYIPTVHENGDKDWKTVEYDWFCGKSGLVNLNNESKLVGNAGMLIRRQVFESMADPWFEMGKIHPEYGAPDLWFAKKAVLSGFTLWLDMDNPIGHISHMAVWPYMDESGDWHPEIREPNDTWGERGLIVD